LADDEDHPASSASFQRGRDLRPVVALAALDFGEVRDDPAAGGVDMAPDRLLLGLEGQARKRPAGWSKPGSKRQTGARAVAASALLIVNAAYQYDISPYSQILAPEGAYDRF
jgi:hypothetical protein